MEGLKTQLRITSRTKATRCILTQIELITRRVAAGFERCPRHEEKCRSGPVRERRPLRPVQIPTRHLTIASARCARVCMRDLTPRGPPPILEVRGVTVAVANPHWNLMDNPPNTSPSSRFGCQRRSKTGQVALVENGHKLAPLGGARLLLSVLESVAITLDNDDFGMVNQSVNHGRNGDSVPEDLGPRREGLIGANDHARSFVARSNEREEEGRSVRIEGM